MERGNPWPRLSPGALLAPSLYDSVGDTVLEAMARGRPVVRAPNVGPVALIGTETLTIDPHRPSDLADVLRQLETNRCQLERLGRAGCEQIAQLDQPGQLARAFVNAALSVSASRS